MKIDIEDIFTLSIDSPKAERNLIGGKAASLSFLYKKKIPVPRAFFVTVDAYRYYLANNSIVEKVNELQNKVRNKEISEHEYSEKVVELFSPDKIPEPIKNEIIGKYRELINLDEKVSIRSSAVGEDSKEASFAGQFNTFLNLSGELKVLESVCLCWASAWNTSVLHYRDHMKPINHSVDMGIVIQKMLPSCSAGVIFTANPITGNQSEIIINANFGLGESVVSAACTPDTYIMDKRQHSLKQTIIGHKEIMFVSSKDQGTIKKKVKNSESRKSVLTIEEQVVLSKIGTKIEDIYEGVYQDIEWAIVNGEYWILQARPITNFPLQTDTHVDWLAPVPETPLVRRQIVEYMPDPVSPLFEEVFLHYALDKSTDRLWEELNLPTVSLKKSTRPLFVTSNGFAYQRVQGERHWTDILSTIKYYNHIFRKSVKYNTEVVLPRYMETINNFRKKDTSDLSSEELYEAIKELAIADALYWFHSSGVMLASKLTDKFLSHILSSISSELNSGVFLQGFPSKSYEAQNELEKISKRYRNSPDILNFLDDLSKNRELLDAENNSTINSFIKDIKIYLENFGHQVYNYDFSVPTLSEDPLPIILNLKNAINDSNNDLSERLEKTEKQREFATNNLLKSVGLIKRFVIKKLLKTTQRFNYHREDVLYYIARAWPTLRKFALQLGIRLQEKGLITAPNDIYYLTSKEIFSDDSKPNIDLISLIEKRRTLREKQRNLNPPATIPVDYRFNVLNISGVESQVRNTDKQHTLKGFPVSAGKVIGRASVISSPAEFDKMIKGTILVCPTVTPAWTPLFSQATGLVTNIGGVLAHGSIVAREYCIPAVMGVGEATDKIKHGQEISIDGNRGIVTLL